MNTRALLSMAAAILMSLPFFARAETYEYDAVGRVTRVVYDDGSGLLYTYDANGNRLSRQAVLDAERPVITLIGEAMVSVVVNTPFTDPGATASDNRDGDLTGNIVVGGTFVDTATVGTFTITYDVSDAAGNPAVQVVRTITVTEEATAPPPSDDGGGGEGDDDDGGCGCNSRSGNGGVPFVLLLVGWGFVVFRRSRRRC
ncbi:MAG: immunoglobulin-like domain-containing protein [Myxococcota bacterium]